MRAVREFLAAKNAKVAEAEDAAKIAVREVKAFLAAKNAKDAEEMEVIFCCFSSSDATVYERILS